MELPMSWFAKIFSAGPDVIEKAADAVTRAGDAIIFTDEEKSETNQKLLDWYLQFLTATNPQNLARRQIARVVTGLWALLVVAGVMAYGFGRSEFAKFIFDTLTETVAVPFGIVLTFYFTVHAIRAFRSK